MIRSFPFLLAACLFLLPLQSAVANDVDGDGIPDTIDGCPARPEIRNGFLDADGCPDTLAVKLQGTLTAAETGGVVQAVVTIVGPRSTSEINAQGTFRWSAPRAGVYRLAIEADGFQSQVHSFLLTPGESLVLEVKLQRTS